MKFNAILDFCSESQLAAYDCVNSALFTCTIDHCLIFKGDIDSSAFFLRLLLKLVLNMEYAAERCFVNGRMVNRNFRTFFSSLGKIYFRSNQPRERDQHNVMSGAFNLTSLLFILTRY